MFVQAVVLTCNAVDAVKIALLGDSNISTQTRKVFKMMKDQGVQVVFHNGDFEYRRSGVKWEEFMNTYGQGLDLYG